MAVDEDTKRPHSSLAILVICIMVFLICGLFGLKWYQYQINPDGISYISIAQHILQGDFEQAVNGYWGPVLSWLLVPFLFFGIKPLLAAKLLSLLIGCLTIVGVRSLSYKFQMSERVRNVILFSLIPILLHLSLSAIAADLLLVCTLVYYFNCIFDRNYSCISHKGVQSGILGSIAYLSKSYAFPFFLFHFPIINLLHFFDTRTKEEKKTVLINFLSGIIIFSIISGAWVVVLSNRYGTLTVAPTWRYNVAVYMKGYPHENRGFLPPPNDTAISAWEDPSYQQTESWSLLQYLGDRKHHLRRVSKNLLQTYNTFVAFSSLSMVIILGYILLSMSLAGRMFSEPPIIYPLATLVLFTAGYLPLTIKARYLGIDYILLILMGGYLLTQLFRIDFFNKPKQIIVLTFFFVSFAINPSLDLVWGRNTGKEIYLLSEKIKSQYDIKSNIGSNAQWMNSLFLSYYLNAPYYGQAKRNISDSDLLEELRKNNIGYYFVWGNEHNNAEVLSKYPYKEIRINGRPKLRIYSLH